MGLCYSLRPLLFGDAEDAPRTTSEPAEEAVQQSPASVPAVRGDVALTPLPRGAGRSPECVGPKANPKKERRRRPDPLSAEEREAEREARKVSRNIDRMLREQKRDLQQTHRLLLLGRCSGPRREGANSGLGGGEHRATPQGSGGTKSQSGGPVSSPRRVGDDRRCETGRFPGLKSCAE